MPEAAALGHAGEGSAFPYRVEWTTSGSVSDVAGAMTQRLTDGSWRISGLTEARDGASAHLRAGRTASASAPAVAADVTVTQQPDGTSIIRLDFAPLPLDLIDGYDEWLLKQGVIVTNVAPEDYDKIR